jgi:hypothetical protein
LQYKILTEAVPVKVKKLKFATFKTGNCPGSNLMKGLTMTLSHKSSIVPCHLKKRMTFSEPAVSLSHTKSALVKIIFLSQPVQIKRYHCPLFPWRPNTRPQCSDSSESDYYSICQADLNDFENRKKTIFLKIKNQTIRLFTKNPSVAI